MSGKEPLLLANESRKGHPYLNGNFAPISRAQRLVPCSYSGTIPDDLAGGQYVRNGSNPTTNGDPERDCHWFDGDGMLSGVFFRRKSDGSIEPNFVNAYVLTDVYLAAITTPSLRTPVMTSISTLLNPTASFVRIVLRIMRTMLLVLLSHLPLSEQVIRKISVANTNIVYHDGRALATCESGPPMRIALPGLETVGWFNGLLAEGEPPTSEVGETLGRTGFLSWMKEWTTAHPRVDPETKEMIMFHSIFTAPFVQYSVLPATLGRRKDVKPLRLVNADIPGIKSPKMMHDFGVSRSHTVILDLPLSLDPRNLARGKPQIHYDALGKSRFGVFPRHDPSAIRWFEAKPCCIFHTANTWSESSPKTESVTAVNLLACRFTSAAILFTTGDVYSKAKELERFDREEEQCRLYYWRFDLSRDAPHNTITHQFALSAISFEFPSIRQDVEMKDARYIYGTTGSQSFFDISLASKIDCLVKFDVRALIERGKAAPPTPATGCVDMRSADEVLASDLPDDPIQLFKLPPKHYAQEPRFVARVDGQSEDDGWLLAYVFDENQLDDAGHAAADAKSELWVIDAINMKDVVAKIKLPQRVPYGLHGNWFSAENIQNQRPYKKLRTVATGDAVPDDDNKSLLGKSWMWTRKWLLDVVG